MIKCCKNCFYFSDFSFIYEGAEHFECFHNNYDISPFMYCEHYERIKSDLDFISLSIPPHFTFSFPWDDLVYAYHDLIPFMFSMMDLPF